MEEGGGKAPFPVFSRSLRESAESEHVFVRQAS
jgi:hypothetical protein